MARGRSTGRWSASRSRRAPEISDRPWEPPSDGAPDEPELNEPPRFDEPRDPRPYVPSRYEPPAVEPMPAPPPGSERPEWERPSAPSSTSPLGAAPLVDEFTSNHGLVRPEPVSPVIAPPAEPPVDGPPAPPPAPPAPPKGSEPGGRRELLRFFGELPVLIALALGIALLIKAFLVQPFYIEQESMVPTLHPSERVLVSKLNYRFGKPARGDVVIFHNPRDPCDRNPQLPRCNPNLVRRMFDWIVQTFGLPTGTSDDLVKRIVALPGETVAMHDGEVYVCNTPCTPVTSEGTPKDGLLVAFAHTDTKGPQKDHDDIDPVNVPADSYFVLGDNRDGSVDSRVFGVVPRKDFVGKVVFLLWPPTRWQGL